MTTQVTEAGTVIYINSEFMGRGDDKLGAMLMGNFLSTLGDFVKDISHILLVNSGVKMACEGSDMQDMMKMLGDSGVEILSCKTCLSHYNLQDKVVAGQVSNMFSILEAVTKADKILTP